MAVSSTAIRAGRAFVELFADDTKLVRGLRRAEAKVRAFGDKLKNIGRRMMAENEADLTAARKEWQDALAEARAKRKASEKDKGPEGLEGPDAIIAKAQEAVSSLGSLGGVSGAIEVQSTFNAMAAARGMGSGGPVDKIKDRVAEIDRNIGLLVQEAKRGGIQFA